MIEKHTNFIIQVSLNINFAHALDYLYTGTEKPPLGTRVVIPFRNKIQIGFITGFSEKSPYTKLKNIIKCIDKEPLFNRSTLLFYSRTAKYYQLKLGQVIFMAIPSWFYKNQSGKPRELIWWHTLVESKKALSILKNAPAQQHIFKVIKKNQPISTHELRTFHPQSSQLCQFLKKKGLILSSNSLKKNKNNLRAIDYELTSEQKKAYEQLKKLYNRFSVSLLDGITGSGKTEIYIRCIEDILQKQQQVLILIPEIGLTPQIFHELDQRIDAQIGIAHSALTSAQRANVWNNIASGNLKILIATRSGVYNHFKNLGLIIVDEEHDLSFRQQDGLRYSARDLAILRASILDIPIILGTATPSLETIKNAQEKRYNWLKLRTRTNHKKAPNIVIKDIRKHKMQGGISRQVITQIKQHFDQNQQVLVFINRRGWAPRIICQDCGWVAECDHCDAYLTWYKKTSQLSCHHCASNYGMPEFCPQCGSQNIAEMGEGTEKISETMKKTFGENTVIRVDRNNIRNPKQWSNTLQTIKNQSPLIIVGTQMLAKGHNFPKLSLVVIVDIDSSFFSEEFRSNEHLAQLLIQVAGRAGRAETSGQVILQTRHPEHPFFTNLLNGGYNKFAQNEIVLRQQQRLPPFSYMAILRAQHKKLETLESFLSYVEKKLSKNEEVNILGPIAAPMFMRKAYYRMQLIFNANNRYSLHKTIQQIESVIPEYSKSSHISWLLDIDPTYIN